MDGDGIGDVPYVIDENNVDNYPLVDPYVMNAIVGIRPSVLNFGRIGGWIAAYIELRDVCDASLIDASTVVLNGTFSADLAVPLEVGDYDGDGVPDLKVNFNRTQVAEYVLSQGISRGNVTLTVTGQLDNGLFFHGSIIVSVRMPGDMNMDGAVNAQDAVIMGTAFGSKLGALAWNQAADENEDGYINAKDVVLVGQNFGKTYS